MIKELMGMIRLLHMFRNVFNVKSNTETHFLFL